MRTSIFHEKLASWAERPCMLVVTIASSAAEIRTTGILRPYYSVRSLRGWALVPPAQHGGFEHQQLVQLEFETMKVRQVTEFEQFEALRFWRDEELRFTLRPEATVLTGPPRHAARHGGRYVYRGGRRLPALEPWMLE